MEMLCGLKKIVTFSMIVTLFMIAISNGVSASSLDVPIYKQGDSRWSGDQLGTTSYTIGSHGCAISSIAMVFKYYGVQTDPKDLNIWLKQNGGYQNGGDVDWIKTAGKSGGTVQYSGIYNYNSIPADLNKINSELDKGYPVIAEVRLSGQMHFVVITGYSGSTYYINDPYYGTNSKLSDHYGSDPAAAILRIVLYHGTPSGITDSSLIPLAGNMDGSGRDITGTFNPGTMGFTFNGKTVNFGSSGDLPIIGDWNGDGYDEIGAYRPNEGSQSYFYLITRHWSSLPTSVGAADKKIPFSFYPQDKPIVGDWNGDGKDDVGGFDPNVNRFYLYTLDLNVPSANSYKDVPLGIKDDKPITGDWDGNGKDEIGVFRYPYPGNTNTNAFYFVFDLNKPSEIKSKEFGDIGDKPVIGDWDGDKYDTIGVYRPATNGFSTDNNIPKSFAPKPPVADFSAPTSPVYVNDPVTFTDKSTGSPTSWDWDFGDGTSHSPNQSPTHTYSTAKTYTVTLTVSNSAGASSPKTAQITVILRPQKPVADFSAPASPVYVNVPVTFTDKSTGSPTSWAWDFGDGGTSSDPSPKHTYSTANTYTVKLTVNNSAGTSSPKTTQINVIQLMPKTVNVSFDPQTVELHSGSSKNVQVVIDKIPTGLSGFNITISILDPEIAEISGVSFPSWNTIPRNSTIPSSSVWIKGLNVHTVNPGDTNVLLGTITITGKKAGTTDLGISINRLDNETGSPINPAVIPGKVHVVLLPILPGQTKPPTDPNHDSLYEDLNGNNDIDFGDVVAYYDDMDWIEGNAPIALFDYNKNGNIDFNDVVKLYDML